MKIELLDKEEKKILIGKVVGMGIVVAIILGFMIYFFSMLKFDLSLVKKLITNDPETGIYLLAPIIFIAVYAWPNMRKLLKDISNNQALIDTAVVKKTSRGWFSRDWYVELEGQGKLIIPYKDAYILLPGKKIEFRITPQSRIMLKYTLLS